MVTGIDDAGDLCRIAGRRHTGRGARGGDCIEPIAGRGDSAMGSRAAGYTDRRDRAADHRLGRQSVRLTGGMRDDRRVLSGVRQHRSGARISAGGACRPVPAVRRRSVRDTVAAAPAGSPCRTSSPACASRAAWRWSARWWRSSSQGQAGSHQGWRIAFWRLAIGSRSRACSRHWCCCRLPALRSTSGSAHSPQR